MRIKLILKNVIYCDVLLNKTHSLQSPAEVDAWKEPFDATEDGNICPQYDISSSQPIGDEDCLVLNVYAPKLEKSKKRAVMVYIHGGSYIMGGGSSYFFGPAYLMEQDVILVTFNYRLGALGFLQLDGAQPGNAAIHDQLAVLKWVKENIEAFGGDPGKV
jgi:carboxylesterase type B